MEDERMMRLDKFLCETGFGTRSQVKEMLKKGQVTVNGVAVKKPEQKIDEHKDQITCQGKTASYEKYSIICFTNRQEWCLPRKISGRKRCLIF